MYWTVHITRGFQKKKKKKKKKNNNNNIKERKDAGTEVESGEMEVRQKHF